MNRLKDFYKENGKDIILYLLSSWLITDTILLYLYSGSWTELAWVNQVNNILFFAVFSIVFSIASLYGRKVIKLKKPWKLTVSALLLYGLSLLLKGGVF